MLLSVFVLYRSCVYYILKLSIFYSFTLSIELLWPVNRYKEHKLKIFELSLFIFRRDLRLQDNTGLIEALSQSKQVIPCFIFDERQLQEKNPYFSQKAFQFMLESLLDLKRELEKLQATLYFFNGVAEKVVDQLFHLLPIDAVFFNRDYTPFSLLRDSAIADIARKRDRKCLIYADTLLHEPEEIKKSNGLPYTVYTPFKKQSMCLNVSLPKTCYRRNFYSQPIHIATTPPIPCIWEKKLLAGGRQEAKYLFKNYHHLLDYDKTRDFPAKEACSHLSAHHKFGTVSIRESFNFFRNMVQNQVLIYELYWRDFFTHIAFHFPHVFESPFHRKFSDIRWVNNKEQFQLWCEGKTGFPIVDAGMRELNQTGFMHNRVRMITSSFLVKDLLIDWRLGEQYFSKTLIDYDPAVNNGNWQWVASTGCDAQPYFRIFNPWLQQKKFDDAGEYVKKWIPELKNVPSTYLYHSEKLSTLSINYPKPMVDHAIQSKLAKALY